MLHKKKYSYKNYYKISYVLVMVLIFSYNSAYCYKLGNIDLKINSEISQSYNDNITFVKSENKEDFITKVSIGLDAEYKKITRRFGFSWNLAKESFNNNNNFSNSSGNYKLSFMDEFAKYNYINLENYFTREFEPRNFGDVFGRISGRYSLSLNRFSLGYLREIKKETDLSVKYSNEMNEYSKEDYLKSYLNDIYINGNYAVNSGGKVLLLYGYSRRKFSRGGAASKHLLSAGMLTDLTKTFYLENKAGAVFIKAYDDEKYIKPVFYSSITGNIDEYTNAKILFEKEYDAIPYLQGILNYWQVSGQFNKLLIKRLKSSLTGFYNQGEYISTSITTKNIGSIFDLIYEIRENFEGNISYDFSRAKSSDENQEYTTNIITFGIIYNFR